MLHLCTCVAEPCHFCESLHKLRKNEVFVNIVNILIITKWAMLLMHMWWRLRDTVHTDTNATTYISMSGGVLRQLATWQAAECKENRGAHYWRQRGTAAVGVRNAWGVRRGHTRITGSVRTMRWALWRRQAAVVLHTEQRARADASAPSSCHSDCAPIPRQ